MNFDMLRLPLVPGADVRSYLAALIMMSIPRAYRGPFARAVLHWEIHPTALIGWSFIRARHVSMGPESSIGPRNMVRGLDELIMEEGAHIGGRNSIWAIPLGNSIYRHRPQRRPVLILREYAFISVGHEIDCSDRVELAPYAGLTGFGSQILSHRLDLVRDEVTTGPVVLGERCVVMTGCILLSGTSVADRSIVSAGSVVITKLTAQYTLYRGNPAQAVRELPHNLKLFKRTGLQAQLRPVSPDDL